MAGAQDESLTITDPDLLESLQRLPPEIRQSVERRALQLLEHVPIRDRDRLAGACCILSLHEMSELAGLPIDPGLRDGVKLVHKLLALCGVDLRAAIASEPVRLPAEHRHDA